MSRRLSQLQYRTYKKQLTSDVFAQLTDTGINIAAVNRILPTYKEYLEAGADIEVSFTNHERPLVYFRDRRDADFSLELTATKGVVTVDSRGEENLVATSRFMDVVARNIPGLFRFFDDIDLGGGYFYVTMPFPTANIFRFVVIGATITYVGLLTVGRLSPLSLFKGL